MINISLSSLPPSPAHLNACCVCGRLGEEESLPPSFPPRFLSAGQEINYGREIVGKAWKEGTGPRRKINIFVSLL